MTLSYCYGEIDENSSAPSHFLVFPGARQSGDSAWLVIWYKYFFTHILLCTDSMGGKSPRSACISGYDRTCIWNILLKSCFNFSRNFWFLTWSYSVIILTMYGHQTRLPWVETRVKIYFWVEIMSCHILQTNTKPKFLFFFFYKCKRDPKKSQEKRLQIGKNKKDTAVLLIKYKSRFDRFHFLP